MTDWMIARLIRKGWLEVIEPTPNFPSNLLPIYHGRSFDPEHQPGRATGSPG